MPLFRAKGARPEVTRKHNFAKLQVVALFRVILPLASTFRKCHFGHSTRITFHGPPSYCPIDSSYCDLLRLPQELFVIGHLNDQGHIKCLLQPPWQRLHVPEDSNLIPYTRVSLKLPRALWRTRSHKASQCFTPKLDCCLV